MVLRQHFGSSIAPLPIISGSNRSSPEIGKTLEQHHHPSIIHSNNNHSTCKSYQPIAGSPADSTLSSSPTTLYDAIEQSVATELLLESTISAKVGQFGAHGRPRVTQLQDFSAAGPPEPPTPTPTPGNAKGECGAGGGANGGSRRLAPLTMGEYERDLRRSASDLQLIERVFHGGMASNELRAALWPYIFGLVKHRGRFKRVQPVAAKQNNHCGNNINNNHHNHYQPHNKQHINSNSSTTNGNHPLATWPNGCGTTTTPTKVTSTSSSSTSSTSSMPADNHHHHRHHHNNHHHHNHHHHHHNDCTHNTTQIDDQFVYIEHEKNVERWKELERLYLSYEAQWKSIMPDQELRFSTFRERKSLIERDVIRSDRSHPFYADDSTNNNLANFTTLLMTYMMYDFDIGYLQGMSDIAAPILYVFNGDLVKSFWVFVEVMKLFRRNFEFSQKTIHFQLDCLYRLIKLTDPKLAHYLNEQECSNCFFAFRCIVCQFKRELMRSSSNQGSSTRLDSTSGSASSSSSAASSSSSSDSDEQLTSSAEVEAEDNNNFVPTKTDDYATVLNLWDTIWCVQRRHELQTKSKCVHTFTIANGSSNSSHLNNNHHRHHHSNNHLKTSKHIQQATPSVAALRQQQINDQPTRSSTMNGLTVNKTHTNDYSSSAKLNGTSPIGLSQKSSLSSSSTRTHINGRSTTTTTTSKTNGHSNNNGLVANGHSGTNGQQRRLSKELINRNGSANSISSTTNGFSTTNNLALRHRQQSITSIRSNGSNGSLSMTGSNCFQTQHHRQLNGSSDRLSSALSLSPASINGLSSSDDLNGHSPCCKPTAPIKQEQIVYTKETFYSSFDPNQADVPRFELTETEKFMLSLCLSMIRRERNQILHSRMDASEIHQHFINPQLANDMDNFIGQAYEIYNFLNTDCDLQRLVKGANQFKDGPADLSPISGIDTNQSDVADTYDLLKDYLIISPTSYTDMSNSSLGNNNLIGSINYFGHYNRSSSRCNVSHKSWDKFINTNSPI